ncbi:MULTISPECIES: hypothetical protein [unclassified Streptomyces]|uniref:hypothetical protein n=1 Tax=unclassified Streptomyces TaxID=2593676 RepID=UPI000B065DCF|nr:MULTISPECIES: hypothetical protein [unclassified Streptomyces]
MDGHSIDVKIVSWTSPVQMVPADPGIALCRVANDSLAAAVAAHPGWLFAALPGQDPAAVAELDQATSGLGKRGVLILGRPGDWFLDGPITGWSSLGSPS